jgi:hypothetical protein
MTRKRPNQELGGNAPQKKRRHPAIRFASWPKSLRQKSRRCHPEPATAGEGFAFVPTPKRKQIPRANGPFAMTTAIFFSLRESALRARRRWGRLVRRWRRMRCRRLLMLGRRRRVGVMVQRRMHVIVVILRLGGRSEFHRRTRLRRVICRRPLVRVRPLVRIGVAIRVLPIIGVRLDVCARIGVGILGGVRQTIVGVRRHRQTRRRGCGRITTPRCRRRSLRPRFRGLRIKSTHGGMAHRRRRRIQTRHHGPLAERHSGPRARGLGRRRYKT